MIGRSGAVADAAGPGSNRRGRARVPGGRRSLDDRRTTWPLRGLDEGSRMNRQARRTTTSTRRAVRRGVVIAPLAAGILAAAAAGAGAGLPLGPATTGSQKTFQGFYDGHKDTYLVTDTSSKAQAKAMKINFAPLLVGVKNQPAQYFIEGRAAAGQLAVFGSEPGEASYSPLWTEVIVRWKAGQKPVLLVRDDQIKMLAAKGELTSKTTTVILNAPITAVGK